MQIPNWLDQQAPHKHQSIYWFRTPMGLESMLLAELQKQLSIQSSWLSHRNVVVIGEHTKETEKIITQMRIADDAYLLLACCRELDHTRASAARLLEHFKEHIAPQLASKKIATRITLSFLGKRNFNRFFVENKLNAHLTELGVHPILSNELKTPWQADERRIRYHLEADIALIGQSLKDKPLHRRPWRTHRYNGQVSTTIAAAMASQISPSLSSPIIDPFCGSGTLLIESAFIHPQTAHWGFDINEEATGIAQTAAFESQKKLNLEQRDSLQMDWSKLDYYLLSNPPWGAKHEIASSHFAQSLAQIIDHSKEAILLLPQALLANLQQHSHKKSFPLAQSRTRGKLVQIVRFSA
ncbi:MAG: N-6 DNA methylase [Bacteroidota bacterium]